MSVQDTLHFSVHARDLPAAASVGEISEQIYRKIMFDTNLLSFRPKENYSIIVYPDAAEYQARTGYPEWSGGATLTEPLGGVLPSDRDARPRTSIVTFETESLPAVLAHEISHLIFNEFMGFSSLAQSDQVLWLNEGFATYEEFETYDRAERDEFLSVVNPLLKARAFSLDEMARIRPSSMPPRREGEYFFRGRLHPYTNIDLWYWQARSLSAFLIRRQGEYPFFLLLNALRRQRDLSGALSEAYPGKWGSLRDLETEWLQSL
jgi:hypothetical protein